MKNPVRLVGTFERRADVGQALRETGDAALVVRGRPRLFVVKCPCGCAEEYSVNLDPGAGKAWRVYVRDGKLTLFPSVWRDSACKAHYIVWNNHAYVITGFDHPLGERIRDGFDTRRILRAVGEDWRHFVAIADEIVEIPWDTLIACRSLVRYSKLEEGRGDLWGHFRKRGE